MKEQAEVSVGHQRRNIQLRLQQVRKSRYGSVFGVAEIVGLGVAALFLLLVIISYIYFLVPARSNLETAREERTRLQTLLNSSREVVLKGQTTEATVTAITQSLDSFESERLFAGTQGRMDLYEELNSLISKNSLRNTSGPIYVSLEPAGNRSNGSGSKSASTKWQSVYPGIAINVTVEGQYSNLRKFVRDIEASKLFLIINSVELERATDTNSAVSDGNNAAPRAALVSLRMDLATYFKKSSAAEIEDPNSAN